MAPRYGLVIGLGLAAIAAGCGEKEEPSSASAATAIARGDEICAEAQAEVDQLRAEQPRTSEDAARLTEGVIAAYEDELADLEALAFPPELAEELDRYIAARERALNPLRDGLMAARAGDAQAYAAAQADAAAGQVERTRLARAVGFSQCSVPAGGAPTG